MHLFNLALLVYTALAFAWLERLLPSVAALYWHGTGHHYASPSGLWWTLALLGGNTLLMLAAVVLARGGALGMALEIQRRALLVRTVEGAVIGMNVAAAAMWLAAAMASVPGAHAGLAARAALGAAVVTVATLLVVLAINVPSLVAVHRSLQARGSE